MTSRNGRIFTLSRFEKEHSSPHLEVTTGLSSCCRVISSSFQEFPSHSAIMSSIFPMGVTHERVFLPVKLRAGADKASMVWGVDFSNTVACLVTHVSLLCHYCKGDEVYITTLLWQNNGRQNGLKLWMLFSELYKFMMNKLLSLVLRGAIAPIASFGRNFFDNSFTCFAKLFPIPSLNILSSSLRAP